jgi:hypothetical protein
VTQPDKPFQPLIELGIDWLAGTLPSSAIAQVRRLLESTFSEKFPDEFFPLRWYQKSWTNSRGVLLGSEPRAEGRTEIYVSVPAAALSVLTSQQQLDMMIGLLSLKFSCSRIDIKLDDFTKTLDPKVAYQAIENGDYTGFQTTVHRKWIESGTSELKSQTLYIGRRGSSGSGKFIRIYTKWIESLTSTNPIDSNRLEIEFSEGKAKQIFDMLTSVTIDLWTEVMLSLITGAIDFLDRSGSYKAAGRLPRLDWWEAVVGDTTRMRLSTVRKQTTIKKSIEWIRKQVAPTFAMVCDYLIKVSHKDNESKFDDVNDFWWLLWFKGAERMNDHQRALLAQV